MDLEEALARIAELEGAVGALSDERDALTGERDALAARSAELEAAQAGLDARLAETAGAHAAALAELEEARRRGLAHLRRALLAEHGSQVVPELVAGDDEASLIASVDVAKQAYGRALEVARAAIVSQTVPAGAPSARTAPVDALSPLELIESGLRR